MTEEKITLHIKYGKDTLIFDVAKTSTLSQLRTLIQSKTDIAPTLQKIIFKGTLKDEEKTLGELGLQDGAKLMLVGSKSEQVAKVATAAEKKVNTTDGDTKKNEETIFDQQPHKKIIEQGPPSDVTPALPGRHEALPPAGISGMVNKLGTKIRLSLKTDIDEILIATASTTQRVPFASVSDIVWHNIPKHADYYVMQLKMGTSDNSNYFIYWVPSQYKRTITISILGYQG